MRVGIIALSLYIFRALVGYVFNVYNSLSCPTKAEVMNSNLVGCNSKTNMLHKIAILVILV